MDAKLSPATGDFRRKFQQTARNMKTYKYRRSILSSVLVSEHVICGFVCTDFKGEAFETLIIYCKHFCTYRAKRFWKNLNTLLEKPYIAFNSTYTSLKVKKFSLSLFFIARQTLFLFLVKFCFDLWLKHLKSRWSAGLAIVHKKRNFRKYQGNEQLRQKLMGEKRWMLIYIAAFNWEKLGRDWGEQKRIPSLSSLDRNPASIFHFSKSASK